MSGSENIYKPSADASREKTEASINAMRQNTVGKAKKPNSDNCDAVKKMASVENSVNTASPNATNISR